MKVEVKTEIDIDVQLDLPEANNSEASFFKSHPHEGFPLQGSSPDDRIGAKPLGPPIFDDRRETMG